MRAFKFTRAGGVGPFTERAYRVGEWVDAVDFPERGVHAARTEDLPYWIDDELWVVELAPPIAERPTQLVATRGRLLHRVESWDANARRALVDDVVTRAEARMTTAEVGWDAQRRERGSPRSVADLEAMRAAARELQARLASIDAERAALVACWISLLGASIRGAAATAAFIATALAAIERAGPSPDASRRADVDDAVRAERRAQAAFLHRTLALDVAASARVV